MPRITISYRREDSGVITGRIFDRLAAHYGREAVFRDIDNIPPGVDFRRHIDRVLDGSDIILAIVGPRWIGPRANRSRLADASDPVRLEIETALRKEKPLIPVLVLRASMPRVDRLPDSVKDFAYRNAITVDAGQDFDVHMSRLLRAMDRIIQESDRALAPSATGADLPASTSASPLFDVGHAAPDGNLTSTLSAELEALRKANKELAAKLTEAMAARREEPQETAQLQNGVNDGNHRDQAKAEEDDEPETVTLGEILKEPDPGFVIPLEGHDTDSAAVKVELSGAALGFITQQAASTEPKSTEEVVKSGDGAYRVLDYAEAMRWYQLAAAQGSAIAKFYIGLLFEHGTGVSRNLAEARHWYQLAEQQGDEGAKTALMRLDGNRM